MATEQDGNYQEMSVHDKEHAALGPTEEAQDVASLDRIVVPPGAFLDPNNPNTLNNTVNVSLNDAAVAVSEDYGESALADVGLDEVKNPLSDELAKMAAEGGTADTKTASGRVAVADNPEDRDEWTKKHWVAQAQAYGLATSGNLDTVAKRVEDHEAAEEERGNFEKELHSASREELDKMAKSYDLDPETYSTKEKLAEAVLAAEYGEDVPEGDKAAEQ